MERTCEWSFSSPATGKKWESRGKPHEKCNSIRQPSFHPPHPEKEVQSLDGQVSAAQEMTEPITGNQRDSDVRPESKGSSILFTAAWPLANG